MRFFLIVMVSLAGFVALSVSAPARAETLAGVVAEAVNSHPDVKAADAGRRGRAAAVREEKAALYPELSSQLSFGRTYADNTTTRGLSVVRGTGYSWFGEGRAALTQTLYDWSETRNRIKAAQARLNSADSTVDDRAQSIAFQAAQAYIQVLRAQKALALTQTHQTAMTESRGRIATLVENGGADESALSQADDLLAMAGAFTAQAETDYTIAAAEFASAVGRMPMSALEDPSIAIGDLPADADGAIGLALERHPRLAGAWRQAKAAEYDHRAVRADFYPELDAEASYTKRDQKDLIGGELTDARALVRMSWDFSFGGAQKALQRQAAMQVREARETAESVKRSVERDVRVAWASLDLARRQQETDEARLDAARQTLDTFGEQYDGGRKTLLDVMNARMQAFNAELALLNRTYEVMAAAAALRTVIGLPVTETVTAAPQEVPAG